MVFAGFCLPLIGIICWLCIRQTPQLQPPRLSFVAFTNGPAGERMALFSISAPASTPILFAPAVEKQKPDGSYQRWRSPERAAAPLGADAATTFAAEVPEAQAQWRLWITWQPQPSKAQYAYAAALDRILALLHKAEYPPRLHPSARIWHYLVFAPGMTGAPGAKDASTMP